MEYAIAQLEVSLEAAEKNAPIWEAEGAHEQAAASRAHAESFRLAIEKLQSAEL